MAEVDCLTETVASRVRVPKAELPNSEIKAKPIHCKSAFNFLAKIRSGLMAYLMECFFGLGELLEPIPAITAVRSTVLFTAYPRVS
jgi:hypothetical protein